MVVPLPIGESRLGSAGAREGDSAIPKAGGTKVRVATLGERSAAQLAGHGGVSAQKDRGLVPVSHGLVPVIMDPRLSAGRRHPDVATVQLGLARVYDALDETGDAEPLFREALVIREDHFGPAAVAVAEVLEGYADLLRRVGRSEEADAISAM